MSFKVNSKWHNHLKGNESNEMKALVHESRRVLERLEQLLDDKMNAAYKDMRKSSNFEDAAWTHKMADQLGYCRALDEIKALIKIKYQEQ